MVEQQKTTIPPQQTNEPRNIITEISESHALLHSTLDALTAHILVLDETGTIMVANATWRRFVEANHLELADQGSRNEIPGFVCHYDWQRVEYKE